MHIQYTVQISFHRRDGTLELRYLGSKRRINIRQSAGDEVALFYWRFSAVPVATSYLYARRHIANSGINSPGVPLNVPSDQDSKGYVHPLGGIVAIDSLARMDLIS
jgi:hypothetical protein